MPQKRAYNERHASNKWEQPIYEMRKISPEGQLLSVINVKGNQQYNI